MPAVSIFDLMTPGNVITYWDDYMSRQDGYLGEYLFPHDKILGLELTKIGGRSGVPVALKASALDTPSTFRDRLSVESRTMNIPYFKEGMMVDEKTRQDIMRISASGNSDTLKPLVSHLFDDTTNLLKGARVARERMAMELISTGFININSNGVDLTYDYGLDTDYQTYTITSSTAKWSDIENSTPLVDMQDWVDAFRIRYGINLAYAVMTSKTFKYLVKNKGIIKQLYPTAYDTEGLFVKPVQIKQVIADTVGITILINDNIYATQVKGGANTKFFPDDVVSFLPDGVTLGNMTFGTTPAEADLLNSALTSSKVSITDTGVAILTKQTDDPVSVQTIVSQLCLPSFSSDVEGGAGAIFIATVA